MDRRTFLKTVAVTSGLACAESALAQGGNSPKPKSLLPTRRFGKTGVDVPVLIIGGVVAMKEAPTAEFNPAELANAALDAGITYFDTAPSYSDGQSERNYGEVLATRRKEVFLATKTDKRSYDDALRQVEGSLKRLQTDHLDLLQLHGVADKEDFSKWDKPDGVLKAMLKLRDEKVTRFIGVTGHESAEAMCKAIDLFDFDTILTTFNPVARRKPFHERVLPLAQQKNMGIVAMKVMGGGVGSLAAGNPIKNSGTWYYDETPHQAESAVLLRYALGLPVSAAVVGVRSIEQMRANVAAARDFPPLNESERKELESSMA